MIDPLKAHTARISGGYWTERADGSVEFVPEPTIYMCTACGGEHNSSGCYAVIREPRYLCLFLCGDPDCASCNA